jgi:hypothetical protein
MPSCPFFLSKIVEFHRISPFEGFTEGRIGMVT